VEVVDRVEGEEEGLSLVLRPGGRGLFGRRSPRGGTSAVLDGAQRPYGTSLAGSPSPTLCGFRGTFWPTVGSTWGMSDSAVQGTPSWMQSSCDKSVPWTSTPRSPDCRSGVPFWTALLIATSSTSGNPGSFADAEADPGSVDLRAGQPELGTSDALRRPRNFPGTWGTWGDLGGPCRPPRRAYGASWLVLTVPSRVYGSTSV
jgi:hypothetical protein